MERILVAVDFSDPSRTALHTALELSRVFAAPLHVVHVMPSRSFGPELAQIVSMLSVGAAHLERRLVDFVLSEHKGPKADLARVDYKVLEGNESAQILREADEWEASLIVAGSHGWTDSAVAFLGSVSSAILSLSPRPVLVVPEATNKALPQRILAALDADRPTSQVVRQAALWSKALGAELTILHVLPEVLEVGAGPEILEVSTGPVSPELEGHPEWQLLIESVEKEVRAAMKALLQDEPTPHLRFRAGHPYIQICAEAAKGWYDLVIVGTEHEQGIRDPQNTAARVADSCPCPVLVLPSQLMSRSAHPR